MPRHPNHRNGAKSRLLSHPGSQGEAVLSPSSAFNSTASGAWFLIERTAPPKSSALRTSCPSTLSQSQSNSLFSGLSSTTRILCLTPSPPDSGPPPRRPESKCLNEMPGGLHQNEPFPTDSEDGYPSCRRPLADGCTSSPSRTTPSKLSKIEPSHHPRFASSLMISKALSTARALR
jgi:hypothetical protein